MLRTIKLLILLVIFSSQYLHAGDYIKDAQDGLPKAQYEYAMSLIEKGKKIEPLTGLRLLQHKGTSRVAFGLSRISITTKINS